MSFTALNSLLPLCETEFNAVFVYISQIGGLIFGGINVVIIPKKKKPKSAVIYNIPVC